MLSARQKIDLFLIDFIEWLSTPVFSACYRKSTGFDWFIHLFPLCLSLSLSLWDSSQLPKMERWGKLWVLFRSNRIHHVPNAVCVMSFKLSKFWNFVTVGPSARSPQKRIFVQFLFHLKKIGTRAVITTCSMTPVAARCTSRRHRPTSSATDNWHQAGTASPSTTGEFPPPIV